MPVFTKITEDAVIFWMPEEMDQKSARRYLNSIRNTVTKNASGTSLLTLDFADVELVDNNVVGFVISCGRLIKSLGGKLKLASLSSNHKMVFRLAGLDISHYVAED